MAILLFLVLAPSSRAAIESTPHTPGEATAVHVHGTSDSRHAYPNH